MASRTYVPSANQFAYVLHVYLTRYQAKLSADKTSEQLTALAELISCLANFLVKWPKPPVGS
jgi:hypothetical protein